MYRAESMILGIVGSEEAKFTPETKAKAISMIRDRIKELNPSAIVSGGCHLGGVDSYAKELAEELKIPFKEFLPALRTWSDGYKERNLKIAKWSDLVICVTLKELPESYTGMRFDSCYHCRDRNPPHVKSGGCWTAWKCKNREWIII